MIPDQSPIYRYVHQLRSRYSETDKMGYVYYGRYLEYFEVARTEMIRTIGYPYRRLEDEGVMLPVVESHIQYRAPIFYDDLMDVEVQLYTMPSVKLETYYELRTSRTKQLHAAGKVVLCFMNEDNRRPCRAPELFLEALEQAVNVD